MSRMKIHRLTEPIKGSEMSDTLGGKGANLAQLQNTNLFVPGGFILTTNAYASFLLDTGIKSELSEIINSIDTGDRSVSEAASEANELVTSTTFPEPIAKDVWEAYQGLGRVAIRSSATAEDLPEASFAGQQDSFLNVNGMDSLLKRIKDCWASLFTERALRYRKEHDFAAADVGMAVVIQEMVDADKSGVLFTADPSTGDPEMIVEAVYGLGEGCVSGSVTPDNYVIDKELEDLIERTINEQESLFECDSETSGIQKKQVTTELQQKPVLTEGELQKIIKVGKEVERFYGSHQDVEWAIQDQKVVVLQSRPITTIQDKKIDSADSTTLSTDLTGLGASGGVAEGEICFDPINAVKSSKAGHDVILVRQMTSPSDIHGMKAAEGILTSQGGETSHAAIVARELDKPAVVGCNSLEVDQEKGTLQVDGELISKGAHLRIDGDFGSVEIVSK